MDKNPKSAPSAAKYRNKQEPIQDARPPIIGSLVIVGLSSFMLGATMLWAVQNVFVNNSNFAKSTNNVPVHDYGKKIFAETLVLIGVQNPDNVKAVTNPRETLPEKQIIANSPGSDIRTNKTETTRQPERSTRKPTALQLRISKELKIVPESYNLTVKLYLPGYGAQFSKEKELKFDGIVQINMIAGIATDTVELSASKLTIDKENSFVVQHGKQIQISDIQIQEELRKVKITLNEKVVAGIFEMKLSYEGEISAGLNGLYQSKYTNAKGETKITAVTQMEPENARKFVPCFDEPEYKATWDVTSIHPKNTTALSNGIKTSTQDSDEYFLSTSFKQTPKMSSYLLAIFVGDFAYREGKFSKNEKTLRVWSRPEAVDETYFALEAGIKSLECYEKLYNISFPLAKQDMLALPDFSAGAMENWGMITYRESRLLYNNRTYSMDQKRDVAQVISHELAHQWFGNLVTMKWWDDLWLNEGFATYMQHVCLENINKDFLPDNFILTSDVSRALEADSSAASHPLSSKIETVEEVMESFDHISYRKGASVIRMIKKVMKQKLFEKGIESYLNKFNYSNTVATDLWSSLNEFKEGSAIGPDNRPLNITELALQWTSQMGYPVLTMVRDGNLLKISAERFKKNQNAKDTEKYANPKYGFKWDVPLWYEVENNGTRFAWLPRDTNISLPLTDKAIVMNAELSSFIRTNYDEFGWRKIISALKRNIESFTARSRYTLISDAFEMASIDKLSYESLFDLISYAEKETHYLPMSAIMDGLEKLSKFFAGSPESIVLKNYVKRILHSSYKKVSLEEIARRDGKESEMHKNSRDSQIFFKYCDTRDPDCIAKVNNLFATEVMAKCRSIDDVGSKCSTVAASLRKQVYCTAVQNGDESVFNKLLSLYKRETDPSERNNLMNALTCTTNIPTLRFLLDSIIDNSGLFRYQDSTLYIYSGVAENEFGREFIVNYMISKWKELYTTFKETSSFMGQIIKTTVSNVRSETELKQLQDFLRSTPEAVKYHAFVTSIEAAEYRLNWIKKNLKKVTKIMQDRM